MTLLRVLRPPRHDRSAGRRAIEEAEAMARLIKKWRFMNVGEPDDSATRASKMEDGDE